MKRIIGILFFCVICFGSAIASHVEYKERFITYGEVKEGRTYWHKCDYTRSFPLIKWQDYDTPSTDDVPCIVLDEVTVPDPVEYIVEKTWGDLPRWTEYFDNAQCNPPCYIKKVPNSDMEGVANETPVWIKETRYE